jgi:hypothetical protein
MRWRKEKETSVSRDGNGYKPTGFSLLRPIPTKEKSSHGLPI